MTSSIARRALGAFLLAALAANSMWAADTARPKAAGKAPARSSSTSGGRALLPDPALLDGSNHPPEKKSEYGMIGDFELPGDENARNQRVGGSSQPPPPGGEQQQNAQGGGGLPAMAGGQSSGSSEEQIQQQQQGGGQSGSQAQSGSSQSQSQSGASAGQAGGIQVADLQGEGGAQEPAGAGEKPPAVAIGDTAMRIPANANNPAVVGGQQIAHPNTQHHDKVGSGGKASAAPQGPNRVEKGRVIPAGL